VAGFAGLWTYGTRKDCDFRYQILEQDFTASDFQLSCAFGDYRVRLPMPGAHNVANAVGVIAAAATLGIPVNVAVKALASFPGVPGRLQSVPNQKGLHVLVDYAHTPDALENALSSLARIRDQQKQGAQLITVFGCGGNRDRGKRSQMAAVAEKYSNLVVVTSDNPRTEDPLGIIHDVMEGFHMQKPWIEVDRRKAIQLAIAKARPGDVILIAGKGHENYQIVGEDKRPFHDGTVAQELLI
jgi:UDP-N-acetylmuramoyl-L-alanyl-D-glutamate--2,6-diaminopimelate ligase